MYRLQWMKAKFIQVLLKKEAGRTFLHAPLNINCADDRS